MFGKSGRKGFWSLSTFTLQSFHDVEVLNETASMIVVPYGKHSYDVTPVTAAIIKLDLMYIGPCIVIYFYSKTN